MKLTKYLAFGLLLALLVSLVSCSTLKAKLSGADISIKEIDWEVDETIVAGQRLIAFKLSNNSDYTITDFHLTFKEKKGLNEKRREEYFQTLASNLGYWKEDDISALKAKGISMSVTTERVLEAGKSISNVSLIHFGGAVTSLNQYDCVEPDIATIKYIKGNQIHTLYYDYLSNKYVKDENSEPAKYWTSSKLSEKIPMPNAPVVQKNGTDSDSLFEFKVRGVTHTEFCDYVNECQSAGFTNVTQNSETSYVLRDTNRNTIILEYNADLRAFTVQLKKYLIS